MATKKKENPQTAGARGKYNDDFPLIAEGLARRRLSDSQIATALDISVGTYYEYQKRYPEFLKAIKKGKRPVDIEVENALFKNAIGYDYEEIHTETSMVLDKEGRKTGKQNVKRKVVKKHQAGSLGAQVFWLINRLSDLWKQRKDDKNENDIEAIKEALADFLATK